MPSTSLKLWKLIMSLVFFVFWPLFLSKWCLFMWMDTLLIVLTHFKVPEDHSPPHCTWLVFIHYSFRYHTDWHCSWCSDLLDEDPCLWWFCLSSDFTGLWRNSIGCTPTPQGQHPPANQASAEARGGCFRGLRLDAGARWACDSANQYPRFAYPKTAAAEVPRTPSDSTTGPKRSGQILSGTLPCWTVRQITLCRLWNPSNR